MIDKLQKVIGAIQSIRPDAGFSCGETYASITWLDDIQEKPTEEEFDDALIAWQAEHDALSYARARRPLYPEIGNQLDDLYHAGVFSAEMTAKLKKVKDDNPKS
jgi:hypothetical protein